MSTDKRKPIPSPKHTLDDVLKTLQDLVRNELADEHSTRARPLRSQPRARADDDGAAANDANAALADSAARSTRAAQVDTDIAFAADGAAADRDDGVDTANATSHPQQGDAATHADAGAENAFGAELATLFADDARQATPDTDTIGAEDDASDIAAAVPGDTHAPASPAFGPEQTSINWDDIPVLNEVVDLPMQPAPPNARTVAVRVVARLNIELRKAGTPPLDPAIIDRLEQLLHEALDPDTAAHE